MHIKNKVALITGASSGLGKGLAFELSSRGVGVCLLARSETKLKTIKKQIENSGGKCLICPLDLRDYDQVQVAVKTIHSLFQKIDILINCAGIYSQKYFIDQSIEEINSLVDTNLKGTLFVTHAVLPYMQKLNFGHIVNVISTAGKSPKRKQLLYSTTKYALHGFHQNLERELRPTRIKTTAIYPSKMNTSLYQNAHLKKKMANYLDPTDVAALIADILDQPQNLIVDDLTIRRN
jgi:uncharacterized protein